MLLLAFLATTALPRDAWYAHRHEADGHGHVHAWDGTRVGRSTASASELRPHRHGPGHDHGHVHGRGHDGQDSHHHHHDAEPSRLAVAAAENARSHHPHEHAPRHRHGGHQPGSAAEPRAPAQPAGNETRIATRADDAAGAITVASSDDGLHGHWQAPFQTAAAAATLDVAPSRLHLPRDVRVDAGSTRERTLALRARAPPLASV